MKTGYDEVRYEKIVSLLRQMPKVSAPPNFESDLMRRINSRINRGRNQLQKLLKHIYKE